ncbi:extracellular solute-binding protein [Chelativorans sp. AA-79]|uniref:extracellular solute-binding protein n=1 Tax=Chelativorans sp. AA-79 TaxID=3028735 RepID=UPI0023F7199D|nr:extracellular solute-binding protein [Chelativorans sp. AA-79]WEX07202.1 extracellular solute-binding protein [Chelativorans sp. AA-79]
MHRILAAAALIGSLALSASAHAETTITLSGSGNAQNLALYEKLITLYNAQSEDVTVEWIGGAREASQFQQQLLRDHMVGAKLPDVILFTGPLLRVLQENGIAAELDSFIEADTEWKAQFSSSVTSPGVVSGTTYGLAYGVSMPVVLFNSQLVDQAGVNPEDLPRDWPGILDLAKKMDGVAPNIVGGFFEYDNGIGFSWLALLESFGGSVMDAADENFTFQGAEGLQALQLLRDFADAGQARADMTRDQARQAFGAGGIGVFASMSSLIPRYEEAADGKFQVVSVPFPLAEGKGRIPTSAVIGAMLAQDPAAQQAAFDFMKFMAGPEGQAALAAMTGYAPTNSVAIEQSAALKDILADRDNAHSYLENLDALSGWYIVPGENGLRIADMFIEHLQAVATLKATPEESLASMEGRARDLLRR